MLSKQLVSIFLTIFLVQAAQPAVSLEKSMSLSDPKALKQSAFDAYMLGNYDKAKIFYEQAMDQAQKAYGPNSAFLADLYFELGTISLDLSKFTVASHYLPLAVEKKPNSLAARMKLAELYTLTGKEEDARVQLEAAQKSHPKSPEAQAAIVKWMIRQSNKARKEEGNPQKEQVLAMASVSGSYYLHTLVETKTRTQAQAKQQQQAHEAKSQKSANINDGLARFAAPVSEKHQELPKVNSQPQVKTEEVKEDPVASALNIKSRILQPIKKSEPPPVVADKPVKQPKPKKEKVKKVQPQVVAVAKPAKATPKPEKVRHQEVVPQASGGGGMDYMTMMQQSMPSAAPAQGKRGKKGAFVPPPPPMIPSYAGGAVPMMYPGQIVPPRLETKAKVQEEKKKPKAADTSASEAPANSEDPEFILEWASVKKKGKGKAAAKDKED